MTGPSERLPGRVGDVVTVVVPNWASAGFVWRARYDRHGLHLLGEAHAGPGSDWPDHVEFRFRILEPGTRLRLELGRPGRTPRETRSYVVGPS